MFKPDLKNTGWKELDEEIVFHISGEKYKESRFIGKKVSMASGNRGYITQPDYSYTTTEVEILTALNDSLMEILWETKTEEELENFLGLVLERMEFDLIGLRVEFDSEDGCVFGWVHYKEDKKTKTLRFKISLSGELSRC